MFVRVSNTSLGNQNRYIRIGLRLEKPAWETLVELSESILGNQATRSPPPPKCFRFQRMLWPRLRDWVRIGSGENEFWLLWTKPNTSPKSIPGWSQPDFEIKKSILVNNEHKEVQIANIETKNVSSRTIIDYGWYDREIVSRFWTFSAPSNVLIMSYYNLVRRSSDRPLIQCAIDALKIDVIELGFQVRKARVDRLRVRQKLRTELRPRLEKIFALAEDPEYCMDLMLHGLDGLHLWTASMVKLYELLS